MLGTPAEGRVRIDFIDPIGPAVASHAFLADGGGAWRLFDLADLDGDGRMDFVFVGAPGTAAEAVIQLLVTDAGVPTANGFVETREIGTLAGVTDLDGDGRDDLVTETPLPTGGPEVRAFLTGGDGVSVAASATTNIYSNPDWKLAGIGRAGLLRHPNGPGLVAMTHVLFTDLLELRLMAWDPVGSAVRARNGRRRRRRRSLGSDLRRHHGQLGGGRRAHRPERPDGLSGGARLDPDRRRRLAPVLKR